MSGILRWEEPPPHGNIGKERAGGSKWDPVAEALRAAPGQWAVIAEQVNHGTAASTVTRIKTGKLAKSFLPAGAFEARERIDASGISVIYARYIGEPS